MICTIFYGKSVFLRPHKYMFPTHIVYIIVINAVQMYIFVYFTYISKVESLVFNRIFITYIALFSLAFFVNLISVEMRGSFDFFFFLHFSLHPVYLQNLHTIYARLLQNCTIVKYILTTYTSIQEYIQNTYTEYILHICIYVVSWKVSMAELILRYDCIMSRLSTYKKGPRLLAQDLVLPRLLHNITTRFLLLRSQQVTNQLYCGILQWKKDKKKFRFHNSMSESCSLKLREVLKINSII